MAEKPVRTILSQIIVQYGRSVVEEPQRCVALLRDLCPESRREVNVLASALQEGIASELLRSSQNVPAELLISNLASRLTENLAINSIAAHWAVESWAIALGCISENRARFPSIETPAEAGKPNVTEITPPVVQPPPVENTHASDSNSKIVNGLEFVRVPAGEFLYGEKKERIWLEEFWIMKCPVTVSEYRRFCEATNRKMPKHPVWGWIDDHPMVNVSWHDANAFAKWEGCRLPMEREWEKAARGTDGREYPWGNIFDAAKCVCSVVKKRSFTAPVGSCPAGASPYGCLDMAGNVWEWCENWYDNYHQDRVLRGGSWYSSNSDIFSASFRDWENPDGTGNLGGFRVVFQGSF